MNLIFYVETMASVAPTDATGLQPWSQAGPAEDQDLFSNSVTAPLGPPALSKVGHLKLWEQQISKRGVWGKGLGAYQAISSKSEKM